MLVEVATDGDGLTVALPRHGAGTLQRVAEALTPTSRQLALAAHRGERPVEVQIGEVEEAIAHRRTGVASGGGAQANVSSLP